MRTSTRIYKGTVQVMRIYTGSTTSTGIEVNIAISFSTFGTVMRIYTGPVLVVLVVLVPVLK
jgi:hypothetical protein